MLKNKLTILEDSNLGIKDKFLKEVRNFYKIFMNTLSNGRLILPK